MSQSASSSATRSSSFLQDPNAPYVRVNQITGKSIAIDVATGLLTPITVCPFVAIVDASIIAAATGSGKNIREGLLDGSRLLFTRPRTFFGDPVWQKNCFLCWMVYAGTYTAVNLTKSYNDAHRITGAQADLNRFFASFVANVSLIQIKDALMVKILSSAGGKGAVRVPMFSRGLFLIRDAATMTAAFCVADRVAEAMKDNWGVSAQRASLSANFVVPALLQTVTTPVHLWALNYAKTGSHAASMPLVRQQYWMAMMGRVARMIPAISIGNNLNIEARNKLLKTAQAL